ncbi:MAG: plasmid recombination protein [Deltaproteobacteria bacterium]|nr:plasmid recombination protein [Deltaproteobacteria bacterium]
MIWRLTIASSFLNSRAAINKTVDYIFRLATPSNADPRRRDLNMILAGSAEEVLEAGRVAEERRFQRLGKPRPDSTGARRGPSSRRGGPQTLMHRLVLATTRGFFEIADLDWAPSAGLLSARPVDFRRVELWSETMLGWARREFGRNLLAAVVHLDETSPHMHLMVASSHHEPAEKDKLLTLTGRLALRASLADVAGALGLTLPDRKTKGFWLGDEIKHWYDDVVELDLSPSPILRGKLDLAALGDADALAGLEGAELEARRQAFEEQLEDQQRAAIYETAAKMGGAYLSVGDEMDRLYALTTVCETAPSPEDVFSDVLSLKTVRTGPCSGRATLPDGASYVWDGFEWRNELTGRVGESAVSLLADFRGLKSPLDALWELEMTFGPRRAYASALVERMAASRARHGRPDPAAEALAAKSWATARQALVERTKFSPALIDSLHAQGLARADAEGRALFPAGGSSFVWDGAGQPQAWPQAWPQAFQSAPWRLDGDDGQLFLVDEPLSGLVFKSLFPRSSVVALSPGTDDETNARILGDSRVILARRLDGEACYDRLGLGRLDDVRLRPRLGASWPESWLELLRQREGQPVPDDVSPELGQALLERLAIVAPCSLPEDAPEDALETMGEVLRRTLKADDDLGSSSSSSSTNNNNNNNKEEEEEEEEKKEKNLKEDEGFAPSATWAPVASGGDRPSLKTPSLARQDFEKGLERPADEIASLRPAQDSARSQAAGPSSPKPASSPAPSAAKPTLVQETQTPETQTPKTPVLQPASLTSAAAASAAKPTSEGPTSDGQLGSDDAERQAGRQTDQAGRQAALPKPAARSMRQKSAPGLVAPSPGLADGAQRSKAVRPAEPLEAAERTAAQPADPARSEKSKKPERSEAAVAAKAAERTAERAAARRAAAASGAAKAAQAAISPAPDGPTGEADEMTMSDQLATAKFIAWLEATSRAQLTSPAAEAFGDPATAEEENRKPGDDLDESRRPPATNWPKARLR